MPKAEISASDRSAVGGNTKRTSGDSGRSYRGLSPGDQGFLTLLQQDYPQFRFCLNRKRFSYRYGEGASKSSARDAKSGTRSARVGVRTVKPAIFIGPPQPFFALQTLHELGHALCKHKDYATHVQRLKIESEAWQRAKTVLKKYQKQALNLQKSVNIAEQKQGQELASILPEWNQDYVEDCLDTYRDWLNAKSICKKCGLTRYQTPDGEYHCPFCEEFTG